MQVISVNVGRARTLTIGGREVSPREVRIGAQVGATTSSHRVA
jgi:hypothetical protein